MSEQYSEYLWDENKAAFNLRKHGVSFDEAVTVFDDFAARMIYDEDHSDDETREIIIGYSNKNRMLFVSFNEREQDIIRIISARLATKQERKEYEDER